MEFLLSRDKHNVTLRADGKYTADELQSLIADLGEVRANMSPPVPLDPRQEGSDDVRTAVQNDPYFHLGLRQDGGFRLWIRSAGLGWITFEIPAAKARGMADFITSRTRPSGNFVSEEIPKGGSTH